MKDSHYSSGSPTGRVLMVGYTCFCFPRTPVLWCFSYKPWDVKCICSQSQWQRGPLVLMAAPRMFYASAQILRKHPMIGSISGFSSSEDFSLKTLAWDECFWWPGAKSSTWASCMNLGVNISCLFAPCLPQFHWQLSIGRSLPKAAPSFPSCVVWDQFPTFLMLCKEIKCFRVSSRDKWDSRNKNPST